MKYKVGDKVRIKSLDWYNKNKDEFGNIDINDNFTFYKDRSVYCGTIVTISVVYDDSYLVKEDNGGYFWIDEMIEGLVEEEITLESLKSRVCECESFFICPDGYIFKDENGNEILTSKIILEKKKKEYPKTYEECCKVLGLSEFEYNHTGTKVWYRHRLMATLDKLILCRDAYWEIAGEEMGLDKPWEPDWNYINRKFYCIYNSKNNIVKNVIYAENKILAFPTEEMRDAFYEAFKELIEICKELL